MDSYNKERVKSSQQSEGSEQQAKHRQNVRYYENVQIKRQTRNIISTPAMMPVGDKIIYTENTEGGGGGGGGSFV